MNTARRLRLNIDDQLEGSQVQTVLRKELGLSGSAIRRAKQIKDGITLDGVLAYTTARVQRGQELSVQIGDARASDSILAEEGPLSIIYEDEDFIVLDKPAPLPVHPSMGHPTQTLCNYLLYYYQQNNITALFHPVNRLDRGTSGLMVVAKHAHAHETLGQLLHTGQFHREYMAVCEGIVTNENGVIDAPIGRVPDTLLLREVRTDGAYARTNYKMVENNGKRSLVSLHLETGRTHQIRVHMKHIGCPLVGDFLYGKEDSMLKDRFALHCTNLAFEHPLTGEKIVLQSSLPQDLVALMK